jgi:hypothetical protein
MTREDQIELFQEIVQAACQQLSSEEFGNEVLKLLNEHDAFTWWENKINPKKFTKAEQEVIHAIRSGWQFWSVDGAIWYWTNNVRDCNGPWGSKRGKNLRVVSSRMINKLIVCGQFPENYKFMR